MQPGNSQLSSSRGEVASRRHRQREILVIVRHHMESGVKLADEEDISQLALGRGANRLFRRRAGEETDGDPYFGRAFDAIGTNELKSEVSVEMEGGAGGGISDVTRLHPDGCNVEAGDREGVENELHVGVVLEIILTLQRQVDAEIQVGISTMQHIMWLAKRDVSLGLIADDDYPNLRAQKHGKLSDAFLRRLTVERYNRTKNERKIMAYCLIVILEGGDEWPEQEFASYEREIEAAEQAHAVKVEEQKKIGKRKRKNGKKSRKSGSVRLPNNHYFMYL